MKTKNATQLVIAASIITGLTFTSATARAQYNVTTASVGVTSIAADPNATVLFEETGTNIDDADVLITLPFELDFFGQSSNQVRVHTNRFVMWGPGTSGAYWRNAELPAAAAPNGIIAPLWDDLILRGNTGGKVSWVVQGAAPNRVAVIEWTDVSRVGAGGSSNRLTFQLAIFERLDAIEFRYDPGSIFTGGTATIGLENQAGDVAIAGIAGSPDIADLPTENLRFDPVDIALGGESRTRRVDVGGRVVLTPSATARNIAVRTSVRTCASIHADQALATPAIAEATANRNLDPQANQFWRPRFTLNIPNNVAVGHYYLTAKLDCDDELDESDETNNE